jgi:hypothetical protein
VIPKTIHYCWFGGKPKGALINDCIASWRKFLPDYDIIEWNERNYSSGSYFYQYALSQRKFAFVSDYARFDVLSKQGGIYLDTDMLLTKSIDETLRHECFFGFEDDQHVSCGIIGAAPGHSFITAVKNKLDSVSSPDFFNSYTIVRIVNAVYREGCNSKILPYVYPIEYFYPYPYRASGNPISFATTNTMAVHLWNASWFNDFKRSELLYTQGKKWAARCLYLKSLLQQPGNIRFLVNFLK